MGIEATEVARREGGSVEPGEPRRARRRRRRILLVTLGLLAVAVLSVLATVASLPEDLVRSKIVEAVERATGRELRIAGPVTFSLGTSPVLRVSDVVLAGARGAEGPPLLTAREIELRAQLVPLLRGRLDIAEARLRTPAVTLLPEDAELMSGEGDGAFSIGRLAIEDGSLNVMLEGPNPALRVDRIDADAKGLSRDGVQDATGTLRWRGEPIRFQLGVVPSADPASGERMKITARFEGAHGETAFTGGIDPAKLAVTGTIQSSTPSVRKLLAWFDVKTGPRMLAGGGAMQGKVTASAEGLRLEQATLEVPGGKGKLDVLVALAGERPKVAGEVAWSTLEVDTIIGSASPQRAARLAARVRVAERQTEIASGWSALADVLTAIERQGPAASLEALPRIAATAAPRPQGWSTQPIDLSGLQRIDLDLAQSADTLRYSGLEMRGVKSRTQLTDGRLSVDLTEANSGKTKASGRLKLDSRSTPPAIALEAKATDAPIETVISELFGSRVVSGKTKVDLSLAARGSSQRDIVGSLAGKAGVTIENGELIGFNLRRALIEWWRKWTYDPKQRTHFSRLSAALDVDKGVMTSVGDLALSGPEVVITSRGSIRLPSRSIDQNLRMKLAPPPQHLPVPLKVSGPWSKPDIGWDLFSVFAEPRELAAPHSVFAAPGGTPPEITATIRRMLSDDGRVEQMPPELRNLLRSLAGS